MISAFGVEHAVSKSLTPDQQRRARERARRAGRTAPNAFDRQAVGGNPRMLRPAPLSKSYLGQGAWKPVTELPEVSRRALKNSIKAKRAGVQHKPEKPLPKYWYHKGVGRIRVTAYKGNGVFEGIDSRDNIRLAHRNNIQAFGKSLPKTVPDSLSVIMPGSSVRAYDNSKRHKVEAGTKNAASKLGATVAGAVVGSALGSVAGKRLKPLKNATKIGMRGRKPLMTISSDMKRGYFASAVGGGVGGIAGTVAGNNSLKRIKKNPRYGYRS